MLDALLLWLRWNADHLRQQITAPAVNLQHFGMFTEFPMADHKPAIEILSHAVEFDTTLIDIRSLLPKPLTFVDSRDLADRSQEPIVQQLPGLKGPRFVGLVFEEMPDVQPSDSGESFSCVGPVAVPPR